MGLTAGAAPSFNATDSLVVTTQPPSSITAGAPFGMVVTAEDSSGNVDTTFNGSVTIFNPADANLGGTLTVTAVNGVATFSGLTEDQAGSNNWLLATSDGLICTSQLFQVTAETATQLAITTQPPALATAGVAFPLTIVAEDSFGNVDPRFNGVITISIDNNPSGATLGGTLTATAAGGVATFSGLTIDQPGSAYTIQATADGLDLGDHQCIHDGGCRNGHAIGRDQPAAGQRHCRQCLRLDHYSRRSRGKYSVFFQRQRDDYRSKRCTGRDAHGHCCGRRGHFLRADDRCGRPQLRGDCIR